MSGETHNENQNQNQNQNQNENENHDAGYVTERWKIKGTAWRVFFCVFGTYVFLNVVGMLGAHAQK
ncbi:MULTISPECIES: hypothetical protein [Streptomyces]|uniref:Uncharacterized protein n=1 Tax=Streptomyces viridochromogenes TaxID=1938 RepID=A0A0L8J369_STRVR|nr:MULTISPECIES: hypothetical protein [Streptomyces]KOG08091.1 hypothetical protein ADK34_39460 [Streptomyces viridochromogenes]